MPDPKQIPDTPPPPLRDSAVSALTPVGETGALICDEGGGERTGGGINRVMEDGRVSSSACRRAVLPAPPPQGHSGRCARQRVVTCVQRWSAKSDVFSDSLKCLKGVKRCFCVKLTLSSNPLYSHFYPFIPSVLYVHVIMFF